MQITNSRMQNQGSKKKFSRKRSFVDADEPFTSFEWCLQIQEEIFRERCIWLCKLLSSSAWASSSLTVVDLTSSCGAWKRKEETFFGSNECQQMKPDVSGDLIHQPTHTHIINVIILDAWERKKVWFAIFFEKAESWKDSSQKVILQMLLVDVMKCSGESSTVKFSFSNRTRVAQSMRVRSQPIAMQIEYRQFEIERMN